jgi:CheY-like chemotaxis protein
MSKNCKEKVLLPYFTTKNENLGLGLTLVNSIVEKHEGHLEIQIEAYFGTSITIYLPILDEVSVKKEVLSVFNKKIEAMGYIYSKPKKMRVLIMDDEELILKMNKKFLEHNGYDVDVALHGKEAVEKYKDSLLNNNSFNAVILDLSIPNGMGGEETAKELLKIDDKCKLIVSSGYSNSDILSNYKDYGFIKSLPKPYKLEELLNIIDSLSYYE